MHLVFFLLLPFVELLACATTFSVVFFLQFLAFRVNLLSTQQDHCRWQQQRQQTLTTTALLPPSLSFQLYGFLLLAFVCLAMATLNFVDPLPTDDANTSSSTNFMTDAGPHASKPSPWVQFGLLILLVFALNWGPNASSFFCPAGGVPALLTQCCAIGMAFCSLLTVSRVISTSVSMEIAVCFVKYESCKLLWVGREGYFSGRISATSTRSTVQNSRRTVVVVVVVACLLESHFSLNSASSLLDLLCRRQFLYNTLLRGCICCQANMQWC